MFELDALLDHLRDERKLSSGTNQLICRCFTDLNKIQRKINYKKWNNFLITNISLAWDWETFLPSWKRMEGCTRKMRNCSKVQSWFSIQVSRSETNEPLFVGKNTNQYLLWVWLNNTNAVLEIVGIDISLRWTDRNRVDLGGNKAPTAGANTE